MTRLILTLALIALTPRLAGAFERYAVLVGSNAAAADRSSLRYAHRDVKAMRDALVTVGGFARDRVAELLDPTADEVRETLVDKLTAAAEKSDGLVLFYYSGHADSSALYPGGQALPLDDLRSLLGREDVAVRLAVIDACRGGGVTGAKGLTPVPPIIHRLPELASSVGSALIASSSGMEDAHESDALQGSFFTHHWVAALRGAADINTDGQVTLLEAFDYAQRKTIRDTAIAARTPQSPSYRLNLRGRSDLPLSEIARGSAGVVVQQGRETIELVSLDRGAVALEIPPGERVYQIALESGAYLVRERAGQQVRIAEFEIRPGERIELAPSAFQTKSVALSEEKSWVEPENSLAVRAVTGIQGRHPLHGLALVDDFSDFSEESGTNALAVFVQLGENIEWLAPLPAAAMFFEEGHGLTWIPWAGVRNFTLPHNEDITSFAGSLGAGVDLTWQLVDAFRLNFGLHSESTIRYRASDFAPCTLDNGEYRVGQDLNTITGLFSPDDAACRETIARTPDQPSLPVDRWTGFGDFAPTGTFGFTYVHRDVLVVNVALSATVDVRDGNHEWQLGSIQSLGVRRLPFVEVLLTDYWTLDVYAALSVREGERPAAQEVVELLAGSTLSW
ncbi:MAG: caspase family protein [Myxococcota bacterium]